MTMVTDTHRFVTSSEDDYIGWKGFACMGNQVDCKDG